MDNLIDFLSKCYQQITIKDNFLFITLTCVALLIVLRLLFVCTIRIFVAVKMVHEFIFLSLKRTFYNKFDYSDYSPVNLKNEKHYLSFKSQLDSYLSNENVKNLAIFGDYGTGKSSLLETYFSPQNKYSDTLIKISLPDFSYAVEKKDDEKKDYNFSSNSDSNGHSVDQLNPKSGDGFNDNKKKINSVPSQGKADQSDPNNKTDDNKKSVDSGANQSDRLDIQTVENEILRQILYSSLSKNIPISLISKFKVEKKSLLVITLFFCVLFICYISFINNSESPKKAIFALFFESHFYSLCAWLDLSFSLYLGFKYFANKFKLSNIAFQSIGVNVKGNSNRGVIDSYIDELTYLFEESKCKYVLFEDLDRTDNKKVLTHLRNLNLILNNDARCKKEFSWKKRRIVFIYVLKRDIFLNSGDSVKFFDAAVNVNPFISTVNSWSYIRKLRNDLSLKYEFSKGDYLFLKDNLTDEFLKGISFYLTDLRLIKDIFNDYQNLVELYSDLFVDIFKPDESKNWACELFSYAVFRCAYPLESYKLNKNEGEIYYLLNRKYEFFQNKSCGNSNNKQDNKFLFDKSFYEIVNNDFSILNNIEILKNNDLLRFLIINNYLSEKYRIFQVIFPSSIKIGNKNFLTSLIKNNDEYAPTVNIPVEEIEFVIGYFPFNAFYCKSALNYSFFKYLTGFCKKIGDQFLLNQYLNYYLDTVNKQCDKENSAKLAKIDVEQKCEINSFLLDLVISMRKEELKENDKMSSYLLTNLFSVSSKKKISFSALNSLLNQKNDDVFILFFLSLGYKSFLSQLLLDVSTRNLIETKFEDDSFLNHFQQILIENSDLMNDDFFSSLNSLGIKFKRISDKLDMSNEGHSNYIINLINKTKDTISRDYPFYFELTWENLCQLSIYLSALFKNDDIDVHYHEKNSFRVLTSLFTSINNSIRKFDKYFYRTLFSRNNFQNLLIVTGISENINKSDDFVLKDAPETVLFAVYSMYSSFLADYFYYSELCNGKKDDFEKYQIYEEKFDYPLKDCLPKDIFDSVSQYSCDQDLLNSLFEDIFSPKNITPNLFENFFCAINCFLDYEKCEFYDFDLIFKKTFEGQFSYLGNWEQILDPLNFDHMRDYCALVLSIAHLLNFSLSKNNHLQNKKYLITPNEANIGSLVRIKKDIEAKAYSYIEMLEHDPDQETQYQINIFNIFLNFNKYYSAVLNKYEATFGQYTESSKDNK